MMVCSCPPAILPVCRVRAWFPIQWLAGEAERAEKREGKIKETGTMSARFLKLLLSAHWLGSPRAAPHFEGHGAARRLNTLALLAFERHYGLESGVSRRFRPEARR